MKSLSLLVIAVIFGILIETLMAEFLLVKLDDASREGPDGPLDKRPGLRK